MSTPTWSILVPTLGERRPLFERLTDVLLPQLDAYAGRVRVVGYSNNGAPSLPEIRHSMTHAAGTDYVSFVDDDDLVPPYFVAETMAALEQDPDYVGWQVQCYSDGHPTAIAYHSLKHDGWWNENGHYYRDISHINPMRTEIARTADFRKTKPHRPEDRAWVDQLRKGGLLKSEVVIDRIMYHYLYSTKRKGGEGSRWQAPWRIGPAVEATRNITSPYFTWSMP